MLPKELVRKLRRIHIYTDRLVDEALAGQYASAFKGSGMEFSEVRQYQPGDEVRSIDWNVTARMGEPFVKTYVEERELTVMLLVDGSASTRFGTADQLKSDLMAEFCAVLGFSAMKNNDRVGLGIFTDQIELFVPPRKGRRNILRLIREVLYFQSKNKATDIDMALSYARKVLRRRAVIFLISDFEDVGYEKGLKIGQKHHDIIAVRVLDQRERYMPKLGLVSFVDPETGKQVLVDTSNPHVHRQLHQRFNQRDETQTDLFKSCRTDWIDIAPGQDYVPALRSFFAARRLGMSRS
ncbi:MAG: DUF58 domain-containing protein [Limnochordia bacterium]|jgi:uncharacterized protein (DUF58 family)